MSQRRRVLSKDDGGDDDDGDEGTKNDGGDGERREMRDETGARGEGQEGQDRRDRRERQCERESREGMAAMVQRQRQREWEWIRRASGLHCLWLPSRWIGRLGKGATGQGQEHYCMQRMDGLEGITMVSDTRSLHTHSSGVVSVLPREKTKRDLVELLKRDVARRRVGSA